MSAPPFATSLHRDYAAEESLWRQSLAAHQRAAEVATTNSQRGRALGNQAHVLGHLAFIAARRGAFADARGLYEQSLALKHEISDALGIGLSLLALGDVCLAEGDHGAARTIHQQLLDAAWNLRDTWLAAAALEGLAAAAAARDEPFLALRLAGAASSLRELADAPHSAAERIQLDRCLAAARRALEPADAEAAWSHGRALSIDQARAEELGVSRAQTTLPAPPRPSERTPTLNRRASRAALSSWYGRLVDVGGHRLYMHRRGAASGDVGGSADRTHPTILLGSDLGINWLAWERVAPHVAADAQIVAYSRAGLRDSEPGPLPRTPRLILDDLDALLAEARLPPPYLLVGHGFGALLHNLFAARRPADVAGVVTLGTPDPLTIRAHPAPDLAEHVNLHESARQLLAAPNGAAPPRQVPLFALEDEDVLYESPERVVHLVQDALASID